jgi:hypothetical protein
VHALSSSSQAWQRWSFCNSVPWHKYGLQLLSSDQDLLTVAFDLMTVLGSVLPALVLIAAAARFLQRESTVFKS